MTVEEQHPGIYRVFYWVNLTDPFTPTCDCKAGCYGTACRHVAAAQAHRDGEPYLEGEDVCE